MRLHQPGDQQRLSRDHVPDSRFMSVHIDSCNPYPLFNCRGLREADEVAHRRINTTGTHPAPSHLSASKSADLLDRLPASLALHLAPPSPLKKLADKSVQPSPKLRIPCELPGPWKSDFSPLVAIRILAHSWGKHHSLQPLKPGHAKSGHSNHCTDWAVITRCHGRQVENIPEHRPILAQGFS